MTVTLTRTVTETDRNTTIKTIRNALKQRSGKTWSVRGDRGTAYGWITISAPPKRLVGLKVVGRTDDGLPVYEDDPTSERRYAMSRQDRAELATLLGLDSVPHSGVSIPASHEYRREYMDRAQGHEPSVIGTPYWD